MRKVLLLGFLYFALGMLGLLLAIPPGYASAIFPSAGIALAGILRLGDRALPGVWLGSFVMNLVTSQGHVATAKALLLAATMGLGAALQAALGAALVRRGKSYPNTLSAPRDILTFLFLGGPVSCLVSATIGTSALCLARLIPPGEFTFNWFNWWVGDTLGVLIVSPLAHLWALQPGLTTLRRRLMVTGPLVVALAVTVCFFIFTSNALDRNIHLEFTRRAGIIARQVQNGFEESGDAVYTLASLFSISPDTREEEFRAFAKRERVRHPMIRTLGWNVSVTAVQRPYFETDAGLSITELGKSGFVPAGNRPWYLPIRFVEPSVRSLGFDAVSDRTRRSAVEEARDSGALLATPRLLPIYEAAPSPSLILFAPVYRRGRPHATVAERRKAFLGIAGGSFRVADLVASSEEALNDDEFAFRLLDEDAPEAERTIYSRSPRASAELQGPAAPRFNSKFTTAGHHYNAELVASGAYLAGHRSLSAWMVLAAGLLFTGLLGAFMLVITGHSVVVEGQSRVLAKLNRDLERSNEELQRFAYIASHDLKEPLRMVSSYVQLLKKRYAARLDDAAMEYIAFAVEGATRMGALIDALLSYARVGAPQEPFGRVQLGAVFETVTANLAIAILDKGADVSSGELPAVVGNASQLCQLFQNLVGNALKFCGDRKPIIRVEARRSGHEWLISVRDNGIGIEKEYADRVFVIFQRLHGRSEYEGTGIGLAVCKKIVERHGGRIWLESEPGKGTTCYFTMPA